MYFRKIATLLAAGSAAAMLALGSTGAANASVAVPSPDGAVLHYAGDGTSGVEALLGDSAYNIGATVVASPSFLNVGGVGTGGGGVQLCDPDNGFAVQLGLTSNGSTDSVQYAAGVLTGAAKYACEGNGVLPASQAKEFPTGNLNGIANGDQVLLYASFHNVRVYVGGRRHRHREWQGRADLTAFDATTGAGPYNAYIKTAADWNMDSAGAGVQQNTTLVSACTPAVASGTDFVPDQSTTGNAEAGQDPGGSGACNLVMAFSNVFVNEPGGNIFASGPGLTQTGFWNDVDTTGGGISSNVALASTNSTLDPAVKSTSASALDVFAGDPTG
jgi:hypothetical protein